MMMIPRRKNEFDLLEEMFRDPFFVGGETKLMKTDIKEKKDKYLVDIDLPGYEKEDIKIEVEDGYLTISAHKSEKHDDKDKHYIKRERYFGSFKREFYIGDVNHKDIKAEFKDGTLKVIVPESPKKDNKKLIDIE